MKTPEIKIIGANNQLILIDSRGERVLDEYLDFNEKSQKGNPLKVDDCYLVTLPENDCNRKYVSLKKIVAANYEYTYQGYKETQTYTRLTPEGQQLLDNAKREYDDKVAQIKEKYRIIKVDPKTMTPEEQMEAILASLSPEARAAFIAKL